MGHPVSPSILKIHYVIYQLSKIKDDIQVVSQFPCLLGHPVYPYFPVFKLIFFKSKLWISAAEVENKIVRIFDLEEKI